MMRKLEHLLAILPGFHAPDDDFDIAEMFSDSLVYDSKEEIDILEEPPSDYGENSRKSKTEYVTWLKSKTKRAAVEIINLMEKTSNSPGMNVVRFQLIKSATSTAANYRAACRARSANEFFAKICIVVEEADETQFWLQILEESKIRIDKEIVRTHYNEWTEIVKIVTSAKANAAARKR